MTFSSQPYNHHNKTPCCRTSSGSKLKNATEGLCEVHVTKIAVGTHVMPYTRALQGPLFLLHPVLHTSTPYPWNSTALQQPTTDFTKSQEGKTFFCFTSSKRIRDFSWDELRGTYKPKSRNFQALKTDLDLIHWQEWSALYVISASPSHHAKVSERVCNCCRYWKQSSLGFS